jgi:glycerol-3-phosphate acyltransferase PlsY
MGGVPAPSPRPAPSDPLAKLPRSLRNEILRKAIHLGFIVLPLELLYEVLPWPRGRGQFRILFITLTAGALILDLLRIHDQRVRSLVRQFFGELIRPHEKSALLGSTYLLLAALLAIEIFPQPIAATAIGFTVLGDGFAAITGRAFGRTRFFGKTLEGTLGGLVACLVWGAFVAAQGWVAWDVVVAGALIASLVEMLPIPLDDNLGMTLFAGYAMKLLSGGT